jgi:hypothetical protein
MPQPSRQSRLGRYETTTFGGEAARAFVPPPLPPIPPIDVSSLLVLLQRAQMALGRLDGMASILPDTGLFLYMYVRKEALLSSQIEGTRNLHPGRSQDFQHLCGRYLLFAQNCQCDLTHTGHHVIVTLWEAARGVPAR